MQEAWEAIVFAVAVCETRLAYRQKDFKNGHDDIHLDFATSTNRWLLTFKAYALKLDLRFDS